MEMNISKLQLLLPKKEEDSFIKFRKQKKEDKQKH